MPVPKVNTYGRIVVLKRTGQDSASFDLTDSTYLFGRGAHCDIRIQLATISEEHCQISRLESGHASIKNISIDGTILNGVTLKKEQSAILKTGDIFTVVERSFRYENEAVGDVPAESVQLVSVLERMKTEPVADLMQVDTPKNLVTNSPAKPNAFGDSTPKTPSKSTFGISASPMRVESQKTPQKQLSTPQRVEMPKLGSPVRVSTPQKSSSMTPIKISTSNVEEVVSMVQNFGPESATKKSIATASPQKDTPVAPSTPTKQMETSDSLPAGSTSRPSVATNNNVSPMMLSTPPPKTSPAPNINALFPATPALAAASRLAETTNASSMRSSPRTPNTPRFSVASAGTPVQVDQEITASPKIARVDVFDAQEAVAGEPAGDEPSLLDCLKPEGEGELESIEADQTASIPDAKTAMSNDAEEKDETGFNMAAFGDTETTMKSPSIPKADADAEHQEKPEQDWVVVEKPEVQETTIVSTPKKESHAAIDIPSKPLGTPQKMESPAKFSGTPSKGFSASPMAAAQMEKISTPVKEAATPIKSFSPASSAQDLTMSPMKPSTPVKQAESTPLKAATPMKADQPSTPVQGATPMKVDTPAKPMTPMKVDTPAKVESPMEVAIPAKIETPVKEATPMKPQTPMKPETPMKPMTPAKEATPLKAATPMKVDTPMKEAAPTTPMKEEQISMESSTPLKATTPMKPMTPAMDATPMKPSTPAKAETPIKESTPMKVATPAKTEVAAITPMKAVKESSPIKEATPMKVETPVKVSTPLKSETPMKIGTTPTKAESTPMKVATPQKTPAKVATPARTITQSPSEVTEESSTATPMKQEEVIEEQSPIKEVPSTPQAKAAATPKSARSTRKMAEVSSVDNNDNAGQAIEKDEEPTPMVTPRRSTRVRTATVMTPILTATPRAARSTAKRPAASTTKKAAPVNKKTPAPSKKATPASSRKRSASNEEEEEQVAEEATEQVDTPAAKKPTRRRAATPAPASAKKTPASKAKTPKAATTGSKKAANKKTEELAKDEETDGTSPSIRKRGGRNAAAAMTLLDEKEKEKETTTKKTPAKRAAPSKAADEQPSAKKSTRSTRTPSKGK